MSAFLVATVSGIPAAKGQDVASPPGPQSSRPISEQPDPSVQDDDRFLTGVTLAVVGLDASGDRTIDAIENSQVTLTFADVPDSSRLAVLCINDPEKLNGFVQSLAGRLELSGRVSEATCTGSGRDDDPLGLRFRLHFESGQTSLFSENPPALTLDLADPAQDSREDDAPLDEGQTEPMQPVVLSPHRTQASHSVVKLPQGWTPVKLPDSVHADSAFGTFDSTVTFSDGKLTVDRKLVLKRGRAEVTEMPAFQKWAESIQQNADIALRSTLYYPDRDASAGTEAQKKAAGLIDEAYRDIEARELGKAEVALNKAEEIDPGHEILHENRGELAAARGDYVTALAEFRKELEAFPNALFEMLSIAQAQRKLGDVDAAMATLQRWMAADPNSPFPATFLMREYHSTGRDDLAIRVGDDAMNIMTPDAKRSVDFLLMYGQEQRLTGRPRDAADTFEGLLDITIDDRIVNDAAYDLSEVGVSLDRAERSVREALTQFDRDSPESALSASHAYGSPDDTSLLLATWDTLGWILYRTGEVQEAEGYVRAAWRNRQDIAISRHLGEILTAEDKPVQAMDVYTMGLAAMPGGSAGRMAKDPDAIAVRNALEQLRRKGNASTVTDPKAALLALRTIEFSWAAKPPLGSSCSVRLTTSEMLICTSEREDAKEPMVVTDEKLLAGFFPPGSKAGLSLTGTIQCAKKCSLVFTP